MSFLPLEPSRQAVESEWVGFPGGQLEGRRPRHPRVLCSTCRARTRRQGASDGSDGNDGKDGKDGNDAAPGLLCFQCYRAGLDHDRALKAAGRIETATEERFRFLLPLEPVNRARLARLRAERVAARAQMRAGRGIYADRRRKAQIEARQALQRLAAGVRVRAVDLDAPEIRLPEAWRPFAARR